ncbi:hypothetical protein ACSMXN_23100 [Jatrophihabitans sp. DSM 45814]
MTDELTPAYEPTPSDRRYARSRLGGLDLPLVPGRPGTELTLPIPVATNLEFAKVCPEAILDTDPQGQGLGVWVLVDTGIDEDGDEYCAYEYAGGIA